MASITDIRKGSVIELDGTPYRVVEYQHAKLGRGGALARTKVKNLVDGSVISRTFKGSDNIDLADINSKEVQFLYKDEDFCHFMDMETYEQDQLEISAAEEELDYLKDGQMVTALYHDDKIIGIDLPAGIYLEVTYTEPGLKGDTVSSTLKDATTETGLEVMVPLFIEIGDIIKVDTETGKYLERKKQ